MKLEKQVCSLELSKRLKELGVKQSSLFYFTLGGIVYRSEMPFFIDTNYSAFTAAELIQLLPKEIDSNFKFYPYELNIKWELHYSDDKKWHVTYIRYNDNDKLDYIIYDVNLCNALSKMLVYLLENNLINSGADGGRNERS